MKQSNFTLGFIITLLSSLSFGFICFLGSIFLSLGNLNQSIIVGTAVSSLLCFTVLGAARLKRTKKNFKSSRVWEILLLILFTGLTTVFTWFIFPHYLLHYLFECLLGWKKTTISTRSNIQDLEQRRTLRDQWGTKCIHFSNCTSRFLLNVSWNWAGGGQTRALQR